MHISRFVIYGDQHISDNNGGVPINEKIPALLAKDGISIVIRKIVQNKDTITVYYDDLPVRKDPPEAYTKRFMDLDV